MLYLLVFEYLDSIYNWWVCKCFFLLVKLLCFLDINIIHVIVSWTRSIWDTYCRQSLSHLIICKIWTGNCSIHRFNSVLNNISWIIVLLKMRLNKVIRCWIHQFEYLFISIQTSKIIDQFIKLKYIIICIRTHFSLSLPSFSTAETKKTRKL